MAFSKALLGWIFLVLMALLLAGETKPCVAVGEENEIVATTLPRPLEAKIDCNSECNRRCQLASRHKICIRACGTCCFRCNCVPPGTSGNTELCPCYNNQTTHNGRKKCP